MYRTHIPLTIKNPLGQPPSNGEVSQVRQQLEVEDELEPDVLLLEPDVLLLEPDVLLLEPDVLLLEPDVLLLELEPPSDELLEPLPQYSPFSQSELGHQEQTVFLSGLFSLGVSNILTENPRLSRYDFCISAALMSSKSESVNVQ
jgi:hypothetical protein